MSRFYFGGLARQDYLAALAEARGAGVLGKLLTPGVSNFKTAKTADIVELAVLHLAPHKLAYGGRGRVFNSCPHSTPGCRACCLNTAGRGQIRGAVLERGEAAECQLQRFLKYPIHGARIRRTRFFHEHRIAFLLMLAGEIAGLQRRAVRRGVPAVARLNATADIPWEREALPGGVSIFGAFPGVQFFDYTKSKRRALCFAAGVLGDRPTLGDTAHRDAPWPTNYYLTYSRTEKDTPGDIKKILGAGVNVAAVFAEALPREWNGLRVIDGDTSDLRYEEPLGVVVGLLAKGKAKNDQSGFVIRGASRG